MKRMFQTEFSAPAILVAYNIFMNGVEMPLYWGRYRRRPRELWYWEYAMDNRQHLDRYNISSILRTQTGKETNISGLKTWTTRDRYIMEKAFDYASGIDLQMFNKVQLYLTLSIMAWVGALLVILGAARIARGVAARSVLAQHWWIYVGLHINYLIWMPKNVN